MDRCTILDCTLRDGGYITDWHFGEETIKNVIVSLCRANLDYIECGYINPKIDEKGRAIFPNIETVGKYLPKEYRDKVFLAMADCDQVKPEDITPFSGESVDGIRVVFYKRQVDNAYEVCKAVKRMGYKLFVQPMVTIDYSFEEYGKLIERFSELEPYAISIVDSFGYMNKEDFSNYFSLLDSKLSKEVTVGFHSHNNMQLAFVTAQDAMNYRTDRKIMIDASLYGMGRGAGNLNTEIITNYYNRVNGMKYDIAQIMEIISQEIMPIAKEHTWGYSPYLFLTGLYHCHPNFACFLLENHDVSVKEFESFLKLIPDDMRTKCRRPYVEELYKSFADELE